MEKRKFHTTRWGLVLATRDKDHQDALEELCEAYWPPTFAFVQSRVRDPELAKDLTQEFFSRLLEGRLFQTADPEKGRFRSFLLASVRYFLADEHDKRIALKRGGGVEHRSLDSGFLDPSSPEDPARDFDRRWARELLERSLVRLHGELVQAGRGEQFSVLRKLVVEDGDAEARKLAAQELGLSDGALRVAIHRFRKRWRAFLRDEVAQTLSRPEHLEDEIRHLLAYLE